MDAGGDVAEDGGSGMVTLATGLTKPDAIALDAQNVYFATYLQAGTVFGCPLGGCPTNGPLTLSTGPSTGRTTPTAP